MAIKHEISQCLEPFDINLTTASAVSSSTQRSNFFEATKVFSAKF